MLETRVVRDLTSLCPAAMPVGETRAGSGILCRVTGRVVATGTDPSSLEAFCCNPEPSVSYEGPRGPVRQGYVNCPVWQHNRRRELGEPDTFDPDTPPRVREAMSPQFITRA